MTPVPLTLPAHSSMMTGTIPPLHGVHHNIEYKLGESNVTLAEILKEHKYRTGAVVSASVLESQYGLAQGFDDYLGEFTAMFEGSTDAEQKGDVTSEKACAWLDENGDDPFFLFVHYYDPHDPYQAPQPFASRFPGKPYAAEIAFTDQCIGQVIDKLNMTSL